MDLNNPEAAMECEHGCTSMVSMKPEEFALMLEGMCPGCVKLGERNDEWSICPCCGAGWRIHDKHLLIKIPFAIHIGDCEVLSVTKV